MMSVENIVCVKWGTLYPPEYVNKLYNMVMRHVTSPVRFVCMTEDPKGINPEITILPIPEEGFTGWWNKMFLFKKDFITGTSLYLDLDLVIVDNIDCFLTYGDDRNFYIVRDFAYPELLGGSCVMKFNSTYHHFIWDVFEKNKHHFLQLHGDQETITMITKQHDAIHYFPDPWVWSYKWGHIRGTAQKTPISPPPEGKIAAFHGRPKPHEVSDSWVIKNWR